MNLKDGLERLQSQTQLPATSNHLSASHSQFRNKRAQTLSLHSVFGEQRCCLQVFPSGGDLAAHLSLQSYAKPELIGPQNHPGGKHPDAMIKDFGALLANTQDATHHVALYSGTREYIKHNSCNKTYISDKQLHTMELCIYHGIKFQVEGLDGEHISQICRCTGSQSWCRGDRRNDWVWVKQRSGRSYGALNGRLLWQLQLLFKIKLQNEDGAFVEYWLALALTTIPENSGNLDYVSTFVQVR